MFDFLKPIVLVPFCLGASLVVAAEWSNGAEPSNGTETSNWTRWRGPADSGSKQAGEYVADFSGSNLRWKAALPGKGCSTPIALNRTFYVTAPEDGQDAIVAIDWNGQRLWTTPLGAEDPGRHRNGSGSNASPTTDGDAIFAYFKSGTLACVELDGTVRWKTNLVDRFGPSELFWDHGTSPVLTRDHVVMARMHAGQSWVAAFDKRSGEIVWKVDRTYETPTECDQGYSTPLVIEHEGSEALLIWGAEHLTVHDSADGKVLWSCGDFNPESNRLWPSIAMPVVIDDMVVICYGRNDRGLPRTYGVRLGGRGDVTSTHHVWHRDDVGTFVPSPIAYQGRVYLVRDRGEVACIDPATGETVWEDAFPKGRASYYASPLIAGDQLYAPREDGVVFVASVADGRFRLLATNDLGEPVIGAPIPVEDRIVIRGENHLYCFGPPAAE